MAWQERLRKAAYTSPSGQRVAFLYEDVARRVTRRTASFEFPGYDGTFIQQLGRGGYRYPLRVFFSGPDHDLAAEVFEAAVLEPGRGKLDHPMYGPVDVVPTGEISRRDDLKTRANQTIIEVTFWESLATAYPVASTDSAASVVAAVAAYNESAATEFKDRVNLTSVTEQAEFKGQYGRLLDSVTEGLASVASKTQAVEDRFQDIVEDLNFGIDTLVADPLTLAFQTAILIEAPARAAALIGDRLSAYRDLLNGILGAPASSNEREFRTADLYASTYVAGQVVAVVNAEFSTKPEALDAAGRVIAAMAALIEWRDAETRALGIIDTGGAYQQLLEAVAVATGFLVEISFTLKQEKSVVLGNPRTVLDLAAELYESIEDATLNFLISSNSLTGGEILELPRGRRIVYYV